MMDSDFDIVNCHEHRSYQVGYYYHLLHETPVVWMMNDLPNSLNPPLIGHSLRSVASFFSYLLLFGFFCSFIDVRRIRALETIVVLDRRNQDSLKKKTGLNSVIVRSGLDLSSFGFRERKRTARALPFKVFSMGIFFPHRRFEDLVSAIGILEKKGLDVTLRLAGSEELNRSYAHRIRNQVQSTGLEGRVTFLGVLSEEALVMNYQEADVFVFPNSPQTWGLAVFEAMACGTPVVVSRGCGASEVLTNEVDALLVQPNRPYEIAGAIERLVRDDELYVRLSMGGRLLVEKNVTWDTYGERMTRQFETTIRERRRF